MMTLGKTYYYTTTLHGLRIIGKGVKGGEIIEVKLAGKDIPFECQTFNEPIEDENDFKNRIKEFINYLREAYTKDLILEANQYLS